MKVSYILTVNPQFDDRFLRNLITDKKEGVLISALEKIACQRCMQTSCVSAQYDVGQTQLFENTRHADGFVGPLDNQIRLKLFVMSRKIPLTTVYLRV